MNDIRRTILWVIFGFSMVLLWDQWQVYNGNKATFFPSPASTTASGAAPVASARVAATGAAPAGAERVPGAVVPAAEQPATPRPNCRFGA